MRKTYLSFKYLIHRWILRTKFLRAYSDRFDLYFHFRTPDVIGRHIYKGRVHEEEITSFLLHYLRFNDGDIWFDVGANIGWYSLVLSKQIAAQTTVHAFEPDPLNFELLAKNVRANQLNSVTWVNKALSDQTETKILYQYPSKNLGRHSLLPLADAREVRVETISLDHYVEQNQIDPAKVKFVKMDIEGYEYVALKGATSLLQHVPCWLCEFSPVYMKRGGLDARDLLELMDSYAYQPFSILGNQLQALSREEILGFNGNVNIFWKKTDH